MHQSQPPSRIAKLRSHGRRVADALYGMAAWCFALMAAVTAYEVFARYILRRPTTWAAELTTLLCAAVFLISGPYVMRSDDHLSITILSDIVPSWLKRIFAIVRYVVIAIFCCGLCVLSFESGWEPLVKWERAGTQWNPPIPAIIKPLIVVVAFVMLLQATVTVARRLRAPAEPISR